MRTSLVSEIIRGTSGALAIIWTAAMLVPIVNMGLWAFADFPYGSVYQVGEGLTGATLGLLLVVVFDWLLLRVAFRTTHTTNVIHIDNVTANIKVEKRNKN